LITWFGKPNTKSTQPIFVKLLSKDLTPHFFARWDNSDPNFTYLGVGSVVKHEDNVTTKSGINTIKLLLSVDDIEYTLPASEESKKIKSSFMFERHLEDFLITNWKQTHLGDLYSIYEEDGVQVGRQYRTDTGVIPPLLVPVDIRVFSCVIQPIFPRS